MSDVQRARWIQLSVHSSPAAPHLSRHFWPGDRPRWRPHTHPQWWVCLRCPSTSFPKLRTHPWRKDKMVTGDRCGSTVRRASVHTWAQMETMAVRRVAQKLITRNLLIEACVWLLPYVKNRQPSHLSSACFLCVQQMVLRGGRVVPRSATNSLRKWAFTRCNIRDILFLNT